MAILMVKSLLAGIVSRLAGKTILEAGILDVARMTPTAKDGATTSSSDQTSE